MTNIRDKIFGMSGGAREVLRCLFLQGPTWDGDIPSKAGRGDLVRLGYAQHAFGFAWLTRSGVEFAINSMEMDREKERWQNQRRRSA